MIKHPHLIAKDPNTETLKS